MPMSLMEYCIQTRKMAVVIVRGFNPGTGNMETWVRISGQIYNTIEDYKTLGQIILELTAGSPAISQDPQAGHGVMRKL